MAAKKTAKKAAPAKKTSAKKTAKVAVPKMYTSLKSLKAAKSKGTAPKGITVKIETTNLVFSVKGTSILTVDTGAFVSAELKSSGFKFVPAAPAPAAS